MLPDSPHLNWRVWVRYLSWLMVSLLQSRWTKLKRVVCIILMWCVHHFVYSIRPTSMGYYSLDLKYYSLAKQCPWIEHRILSNSRQQKIFQNWTVLKLFTELLISEWKCPTWIREVFSATFVILFVSYRPCFCYELPCALTASICICRLLSVWTDQGSR